MTPAYDLPPGKQTIISARLKHEAEHWHEKLSSRANSSQESLQELLKGYLALPWTWHNEQASVTGRWPPDSQCTSINATTQTPSLKWRQQALKVSLAHS